MVFGALGGFWAGGVAQILAGGGGGAKPPTMPKKGARILDRPPRHFQKESRTDLLRAKTPDNSPGMLGRARCFGFEDYTQRYAGHTEITENPQKTKSPPRPPKTDRETTREAADKDPTLREAFPDSDRRNLGFRGVPGLVGAMYWPDWSQILAGVRTPTKRAVSGASTMSRTSAAGRHFTSFCRIPKRKKVPAS